MNYVTTNKEYFPTYEVADRLKLYGWDFDVLMTKSSRFGQASALQGGRLIYFEMKQSGELVCLFSDGKWLIDLDEDNDIAQIALQYFLAKHNKKRSKKDEKEYGIL